MSLLSLSRREMLATSVASAALLGGPHPAFAQSANAQLKQLFDKLSDALLTDAPETATSLGLDKGARAGLKSQLSDQSCAHVSKDPQVCTQWLARRNAIPDAQLDADAKRDKAVIAYALALGCEGGNFPFGDNALGAAMSESLSPYVVSQQHGSFVGIPDFLDSQHKIDNAADCDAYLARLTAFATILDDETDRVRRDAGHGVMPPDFLLATATGQMQAFLAGDPARSGLVASLVARAKAKGIAGDYESRATEVVRENIYPALTRQFTAVKEVAAKATHDAGVWKLPDGEAYYAFALKVGTTTAMGPKEIHQLGLDQKAQIQARMDALLKKQGLAQGTVGARMAALGKDPRFLFPDNDDGRAQIIAYLNERIAAVRAKLPEAFNLRLKAPVVVHRVPPEIQNGAGLGYMNFGALDGSRPSIYYINLRDTALWPRFALPSLTYHETIPGHAWQGSYMTETNAFPLVRTILSGFNAYVEGWALYAEQLADELGMYTDDPWGELGYLQAQNFRACRLVADTGLHAMRWTREQTIDFLVAEGGRARAAMQSESDRYCASPGQACGYKIGHTEINRLRDAQKVRLGARFDLKNFNDAVVKAGPMPLTVLGELVAA